MTDVYRVYRYKKLELSKENLNLLCELYESTLPECMHLTEYEYELLLETSGFIILAFEGEEIVAGTHAVPAKEMEMYLNILDHTFEAKVGQIHICSVAVTKRLQNNGIGRRIWEMVLDESERRGFTSTSAYLSTSFDWHKKVARLNSPYDKKIIQGFWSELEALGENGDVEYQESWL